MVGDAVRARRALDATKEAYEDCIEFINEIISGGLESWKKEFLDTQA